MKVAAGMLRDAQPCVGAAVEVGWNVVVGGAVVVVVGSVGVADGVVGAELVTGWVVEFGVAEHTAASLKVPLKFWASCPYVTLNPAGGCSVAADASQSTLTSRMVATGPMYSWKRNRQPLAVGVTVGAL